MSADGPDFYDDEAVLVRYAAARAREDNANDTLEAPIIDELVGKIAGARIVDLGCGDAAYGRQLLAQGAASYTGIEGSGRMVEAARTCLRGTPGTVVHARIEAWNPELSSCDLVISRLALHYVEDTRSVAARVVRALAPGGRFIASVEHPVITSCARAWDGAGPRQDWIVDRYFETGPRVTTWLGATVTKHHRTVEQYVGELVDAGLVLTALRESTPRREYFTDEATFERRRRIPLFLMLAARH